MSRSEQRLAEDKMRAEIAKLHAETARIAGRRRFYLVAVVIGAVFVGMAIAKIFL